MKINSKTNIYIWILRLLSIISLYFFIYAVKKNLQNSLWSDEAFNGLAARKNIIEIIKIMVNDNNPPLHVLITTVFTYLLGESEFSLRLPSILCIIGTTLLLRYWIKNKESKEIATILFLTSSHSYLWATEARFYALFMFLYLSLIIITRKNIKESNLKNKILWITISSLLLYTHTLGIIAWITICIYWILQIYIREKSLKKLLPIFPFVLIPFFLYIPWIFVITRQLKVINTVGFWLKFKPEDSWLTCLIEFLYPKSYEMFANMKIIHILAIFLLIYFMVLSEILIRCKKRYVYLFWIPFIIFFFVSFKQPIMYIRYLIWIFPVYIRIIAEGSVKKLKAPIAISLLIIYINLYSFYIFYQKPHKLDYKTVFEQANEYIKSDKYTIISQDEYSFYTCEYYARNCLIVGQFESYNRQIGDPFFTREKFINKENLGNHNKVLLVYKGTSNPYIDQFENFTETTRFSSTTSTGIITISILDKN